MFSLLAFIYFLWDKLGEFVLKSKHFVLVTIFFTPRTRMFDHVQILLEIRCQSLLAV